MLCYVGDYLYGDSFHIPRSEVNVPNIFIILVTCNLVYIITYIKYKDPYLNCQPFVRIGSLRSRAYGNVIYKHSEGAGTYIDDDDVPRQSLP